MRLYHTSDIHLGRRRLDGRLPDEDMAVAFRAIAQAAIDNKADAFLVAGDLFDRAQVEPGHLRQAQGVLLLLKDAGIPVIAIEGNHDKHCVSSDQPTWIQFLAQDGLLAVLRPLFNDKGAVLDQWNPATQAGAWIELNGVRFVGAGYLGAATPAKVRQMLSALEPGRRYVMLLHAAPEYFVGEGGGFSKDDLAALEANVRYLALGHMHLPMRHKAFACNPGSPENCELREMAYGADAPRGYAVVELDETKPDAPVAFEIRTNPRRPCHRVELDCTAFGNKLKHGGESLVKNAVDAIGRLVPSAEAVIDLVLTGCINLNRIALDQQAAALEIGTRAHVCAVSIDATRLNIDDGVGVPGAEGGSQLPREEIERIAISQLLDQEALWGLGAQSGEFAGLLIQLKDAVGARRSADVMAEMVATSPLVAAVCEAKAATPPPPADAVPADAQQTTEAQP